MHVFETLNKIYKLPNISPGQRSHESLRHQGYPDLRSRRKVEFSQTEVDVEYVLDRISRFEILAGFGNHVSRRKSRRAESLAHNWRLCSSGVVVLSKVVSFSVRLFTLVASHWTSTQRSTNMPVHPSASNSKLVDALNSTGTLHIHQALGKIQVFCSAVCCELSGAVHLNINLDIGQAPGNIPVRVFTSFFKNCRCGEHGPGDNQDACRHVSFELREFRLVE